MVREGELAARIIRSDLRAVHGHDVPAALEVLVIEDGSAHDGKGGVAPDEVVGEKVDKVQKFGGRSCIDVHGDVFLVDGDAVLLVIGIGRVLQEPLLSAEGEPNRAEVAAGGMGGRSLKALVFETERAGGVFVPLRRREELCDVLIVLFWFA